MKIIRTMADIQALKTNEHLPSFYVEAIQRQFLLWYEAEEHGETLDSFCLPLHSCIYHLETDEDSFIILDNLMHVEYIDVEETDEGDYFRMGMMQEHEMSVVYFLAGTFSKRMEWWLAN